MNEAEQRKILEGMKARGRPQARSLSRGTSRSNSVAASVLEDQERPEDVTFRNPSQRLTQETASKQTEDDLSDEERLEDTDYEFRMEDEGRVLPNYQANDQGHSVDGDDSEVVNAFVDRHQLKKAERAKTIDSLVANSKAIANAQSIGREVPQNIISTVGETAKDVGANINIDPEYYNERGAPQERLEDYSVYKRKVITPTDDFIAPYTSDMENKVDVQLASLLNSKTKLSQVDSDVLNQRAVGTITRGNFFESTIQSNNKHPKSFMLCMDFSEESKYALEWTVGTVLVDGSVLYVFNVLDDSSNPNLNGIQPNKDLATPSPVTTSERERIRVNNVHEIQTQVQSLLSLTKLQVHVVIVSCHHPIPKQLIVSISKQMSPTLIIVGSKGIGALRGVIGGSLSNFLVRRCTSPVMVVKSRLKKLTKKSKFSNVIHGLAEAKID